jgi:hypothetical protein
LFAFLSEVVRKGPDVFGVYLHRAHAFSTQE